MPPLDTTPFVEEHGLLGKWRVDDQDYRQARGFWLVDHCREALWALGVLFSEPFHAEQAYPSFAHALHAKMQIAVPFDAFARWCWLAVLAHDLGKAGGEFQHMLWSLELAYRRAGGLGQGAVDPGAVRARMRRQSHHQVYRHELLSALLLYHHPRIRDWFTHAAGSEDGLAVVLAGAFGHHLKADQDRAIRERMGGSQERPVYLSRLAADIQILLTQTPGWLCWKPLDFPSLEDWQPGHPVTSAPRLADSLMDMAVDPLFDGVDDTPVSAAIKWIVILADTFGSIDALQGENQAATRERLLRSLRAAFAPTSVDYVRRIHARLIGSPGALAKLTPEQRRVDPATAPPGVLRQCTDAMLEPFQRKCRTRKNLIATTSTGGGKTIGAVNWASMRPDRSLIFCAHTTDAATCLFGDYADLTDDVLRHSRAWVDVQLRATPQGEPREDAEAQAEAQNAVDALHGCAGGVTFTTADQVLGLMAYYRKSVVWLPYLLKSQVTFDEVHSYDPLMRAWHHRFLEWFPGIPTAHLSATIPEVARQQIEARITEPNPPVPGSPGPRIVRDSRRGGQPRRRPRYRIHIIPDSTMAADLFDAGTIWFANTVGRCQEIGANASDPVVYHSRFRFMDRDAVRQRLLAAFSDGRRGERVVATQAAEMSLDISARTLVSEVAPPASVMQRLGRCNRERETNRIADAYFYMPAADHGLPYSTGRATWRQDFDRWLAWLRQFEGSDVSLDDLEAAFQDFHRQPFATTEDRRVHPSLLETRRMTVRAAIITAPCLLAADLEAMPGMNALEAVRHSVPVVLFPAQRRALLASGARHGRYYVVGTEHGLYDAQFGFVAAK